LPEVRWPPISAQPIARVEPAKLVAKPSGIAASVRTLFRTVMKAITQPHPSSQQTKTNGKDEVVAAFKGAGRALFRRLVRIPVLRGMHEDWDAFTWLRVWGYDVADGLDSHHETPPAPDSDYSPHP